MNNNEIIKDEVLKEEELENEKELKKEIKERRKKFRIGKLISNIICSILILIVIFEAAIGIINMQRINDEKEPIWYLNTQKKDTELKNETIYNLGLYKIIRTETSKKVTVTLKPFFMGN